VRDRYAAHGAPLAVGTRIEHATTYLARALALRPEMLSRPKLPGPIAYHDPCDLARGLDETAAPRRILAAAVEGGAREAVRCGRDAACCGAGGLFPETFPEVAAKVAAERKAELAETSAEVASASPACEAALGASDVVSVLARWLLLKSEP
jgi:Fe-S oxidoreductase